MVEWSRARISLHCLKVWYVFSSYISTLFYFAFLSACLEQKLGHWLIATHSSLPKVWLLPECEHHHIHRTTLHFKWSLLPYPRMKTHLMIAFQITDNAIPSLSTFISYEHIFSLFSVCLIHSTQKWKILLSLFSLRLRWTGANHSTWSTVGHLRGICTPKLKHSTWRELPFV